ncbi:MAG: hypothetical protein MJA83_01320, partial [Gammaproteobacteria bacterium]|nr:hypothetical protein [Gammaproteobacteria bacterium]
GGDILLDVQGISVAEADAYEKIRKAIASLQQGDKLTVKVLREGRIEELSMYITRAMMGVY